MLTCAHLGGCSQPSALRLEQAWLSSPERRLDLVSEQVYWTQSDGVCRALAEMPLPGAGTGRPTYLLYLRMLPATDAKGKTIPARDVRGFLIQTRGARKGLTPVTTAEVLTAPPRSARAGRHLRLGLGLAFEDGSRLTGTLFAIRDDWRLLRFETHTHPADVQAMIAAPAASAESTREQVD